MQIGITLYYDIFYDGGSVVGTGDAIIVESLSNGVTIDNHTIVSYDGGVAIGNITVNENASQLGGQQLGISITSSNNDTQGIETRYYTQNLSTDPVQNYNIGTSENPFTTYIIDGICNDPTAVNYELLCDNEDYICMGDGGTCEYAPGQLMSDPTTSTHNPFEVIANGDGYEITLSFYDEDFESTADYSFTNSEPELGTISPGVIRNEGNLVFQDYIYTPTVESDNIEIETITFTATETTSARVTTLYFYIRVIPAGYNSPPSMEAYTDEAFTIPYDYQCPSQFDSPDLYDGTPTQLNENGDIHTIYFKATDLDGILGVDNIVPEIGVTTYETGGNESGEELKAGLQFETREIPCIPLDEPQSLGWDCIINGYNFNAFEYPNFNGNGKYPSQIQCIIDTQCTECVESFTESSVMPNQGVGDHCFAVDLIPPQDVESESNIVRFEFSVGVSNPDTNELYNSFCNVIEIIGSDCNGVVGGIAFIDDCGICVGGNTGLIANFDMDCNGECALDSPISCEGNYCGLAEIDDCGVCRTNTGIHTDNQHPSGIISGTTSGSVQSECDTWCAGVGACTEPESVFTGETSIWQTYCLTYADWNIDQDCAGECPFVDGNPENLNINYGSVLDECGICGGDGVQQDCGCGTPGEFGIPEGTCDCFGTTPEGLYGSSIYDCDGNCCDESLPECAATYIEDCAGICDGNAIEDECGVCSGGEGTNGCIQTGDLVWECPSDSGGGTAGPGSGKTYCAFDDECDYTGVDAPDVCESECWHIPNYEQDCNGDCDGTAYYPPEPLCSGVCVGGETGLDENCCFGCTEPTAFNWDEESGCNGAEPTIDDGSCFYRIGAIYTDVDGNETDVTINPVPTITTNEESTISFSFMAENPNEGDFPISWNIIDFDSSGVDGFLSWDGGSQSTSGETKILYYTAPDADVLNISTGETFSVTFQIQLSSYYTDENGNEIQLIGDDTGTIIDVSIDVMSIDEALYWHDINFDGKILSIEDTQNIFITDNFGKGVIGIPYDIYGAGTDSDHITSINLNNHITDPDGDDITFTVMGGDGNSIQTCTDGLPLSNQQYEFACWDSSNSTIIFSNDSITTGGELSAGGVYNLLNPAILNISATDGTTTIIGFIEIVLFTDGLGPDGVIIVNPFASFGYTPDSYNIKIAGGDDREYEHSYVSVGQFRWGPSSTWGSVCSYQLERNVWSQGTVYDCSGKQTSTASGCGDTPTDGCAQQFEDGCVVNGENMCVAELCPTDLWHPDYLPYENSGYNVYNCKKLDQTPNYNLGGWELYEFANIDYYELSIEKCTDSEDDYGTENCNEVATTTFANPTFYNTSIESLINDGYDATFTERGFYKITMTATDDYGGMGFKISVVEIENIINIGKSVKASTDGLNNAWQGTNISGFVGSTDIDNSNSWWRNTIKSSLDNKDSDNRPRLGCYYHSEDNLQDPYPGYDNWNITVGKHYNALEDSFGNVSGSADPHSSIEVNNLLPIDDDAYPLTVSGSGGDTSFWQYNPPTGSQGSVHSSWDELNVADGEWVTFSGHVKVNSTRASAGGYVHPYIHTYSDTDGWIRSVYEHINNTSNQYFEISLQRDDASDISNSDGDGTKIEIRFSVYHQTSTDTVSSGSSYAYNLQVIKGESAKRGFPFTPDVDARTPLGIFGSGESVLHEYYDKYIQPEKYNETVAPTKVQFFFYPRKQGSGTGGIFSTDNYRKKYDWITFGTTWNMYVGFIEWGDGETEFFDEPKLLKNGVHITHEYQNYGVHTVTGYMFMAIIDPNDSSKNIGVYNYKKFRYTFNLNKGESIDLNDSTFIPYDETSPIISGISNNSIYSKTIRRQLGYVSFEDETGQIDVGFDTYRDKLETEMALSYINSNFLGSAVNAFTDKYNDGYNSSNDIIYDGSYLKLFEEMGSTLGDTDIAQVRYLNTGNIQMWELLGFECDDYITEGEDNLLSLEDAAVEPVVGSGADTYLWHKNYTWEELGIGPDEWVTFSGEFKVSADRAAAGGEVRAYMYISSESDGWVTSVQTPTAHPNYSAENCASSLSCPTEWTSFSVSIQNNSTAFINSQNADDNTPGADDSTNFKPHFRVYHLTSNMVIQTGTSYARNLKINRGDTATPFTLESDILETGECERVDTGTPDNERYWKNIIPEYYDIFTDRNDIGYILGDCNGDGIIDSNDTALIVDMISGATSTPQIDTIEFYRCDVNGDGTININDRNSIASHITGTSTQCTQGNCKGYNIGEFVHSIDTSSPQNWIDDYYYPVLPRLNKFGKFDETLGLQNNNIPFGNRQNWDDDSDAYITNVKIPNKFISNILIDLSFEEIDDNSLDDIGGNNNTTILINDYRINFDVDTKEPSKSSNVNKTRLNKKGKAY